MARETGGYGMNARESLSADRIAEDAFRDMYDVGIDDPTMQARALVAIAVELRAQRVYANYLEGRSGTRTSEKRKAES
jgi:hypothetical protein